MSLIRHMRIFGVFSFTFHAMRNATRSRLLNVVLSKLIIGTQRRAHCMTSSCLVTTSGRRKRALRGCFTRRGRGNDFGPKLKLNNVAIAIY